MKCRLFWHILHIFEDSPPFRTSSLKQMNYWQILSLTTFPGSVTN